VYADTDAVFVRRLTNELRAYEAVGSYDWPQWFAPFPDLLNLGVALGKPGSQFWRLCQASVYSLLVSPFSFGREMLLLLLLQMMLGPYVKLKYDFTA
jgi:hypothetical protein